MLKTISLTIYKVMKLYDEREDTGYEIIIIWQLWGDGLWWERLPKFKKIKKKDKFSMMENLKWTVHRSLQTKYIS